MNRLLQIHLREATELDVDVLETQYESRENDQREREQEAFLLTDVPPSVPDVPDYEESDLPTAPTETQVILGASREKKVSIRFLSLDEIDSIYARLPEFTDLESLKSRDHFGREATLKLPEVLKGSIQSVTFPPQDLLAKKALIDKQKEAPALEVMSVSPENLSTVETSGFCLRVLFSQPMIDQTLQTSHTLEADARQAEAETEAEVDMKKLPVQVEPTLPDGTWTWTSPTTLEYRPDFLLVGSTKYTCVIPQGQKSANGYEIKKAVVWKFSTPELRAEKIYPLMRVPVARPLIGVKFSQEVVGENIARLIRVKQKGVLGRGTDIEVAYVPPEEVLRRFEEDSFEKLNGERCYPTVGGCLVPDLSPFVFVCPTQPLALDKDFKISIPSELDSRDGNIPSKIEFSSQFKSLNSLELSGQGLSGLKATFTGRHFDRIFTFSRHLDKEFIEAEFGRLIVTNPPMREMSVVVEENRIHVKAECEEDVTYRFRLNAEIRDAFGISLSSGVSYSMKTVRKKLILVEGYQTRVDTKWVKNRVDWNLHFSDRLDKTFCEENMGDLVVVEPPLQDQAIVVEENDIRISGILVRTMHVVRVTRQVKDWDDYRLEEEKVFEVDVLTPEFRASRVGRSFPSEILERTKIEWRISCVNEIDRDVYLANQADMIRVDGLDGCTVWIEQEKFVVQGIVKVGRRNVSVTLTTAVEDVFGNRLEKDITFQSKIVERVLRLSRSPHGTEVFPHEESTWQLRFSDVLDIPPEALTGENPVVQIDPPLENQSLSLDDGGKIIFIRGKPRELTRYTCIVNTEIKDTFGTPLTKRYTLHWNTKKIPRQRPTLQAQHHSRMIVFDPTDPVNEPPCVRFQVKNYEEIRAIVFRVDPLHYDKCPLGRYKTTILARDRISDIFEVIGLPKSCVVFDELVPTNCDINKLKEVRMNVVPFLQHKEEGLGQLFVCLVNPDDMYRSQFIWIQSTRIAVDALFANDRTLTLCATSLVSGAAIRNPRFQMIRPQEVERRVVSKRVLLRKTELKRVCEWEEEAVSVLDVSGDEMGLAVYELPGDRFKKRCVVCSYANDVCFLPNVGCRISPEETNQPRLLAFVFDDKKIFKPKEKVRVRAMLRKLVHAQGEPRRLETYPAETKVKYKVLDGQSVKFEEGELLMDDCSGIFLEFDIKDGANLGDCQIRFKLLDPVEYDGKKFQHHFQIEEFKQPEFKTGCKVLQRTYVANDRAIATCSASYFSGAGLSDCQVNWEVNQKPTDYRPPGPFEEFEFKLMDDHNKASIPPFEKKRRYMADEPKPTYKFSGRTDKDGEQKLLLELRKPGVVTAIPPSPRLPVRVLVHKTRPKTIAGVELRTIKDVEFVTLIGRTAGEVIAPVHVTAKANIQDLSRETLSSQSSFMVHPCSYYIGVKKKMEFVAADADFPVDLVVTDPNGHPIGGTEVTLELYRYQRKVHEARFTSAEGIMEIAIKMKFGTGRFHLVATVADELGLKNASSLSFLVSGSVEAEPEKKPEEEEETELKTELEIQEERSVELRTNVTIAFDKKEYLVGDEAGILIRSPIAGEGVLLIVGGGVIHREKFVLGPTNEYVARLTMTEEFVPSTTVNVYVFGHSQRIDINDLIVDWDEEANDMPSHAKGQALLTVSPESYALQVEVTPEEEILPPSADSTVRVQVSKGNSIVTLLIVDESVLALTDHNLRNPVAEFYPPNIMKTYDSLFRVYVFWRMWKANLAKIEEERRRREEEKRLRELEEERRREAERQRLEAERLAQEEARRKRLEEEERQRLNRLRLQEDERRRSRSRSASSDDDDECELEADGYGFADGMSMPEMAEADAPMDIQMMPSSSSSSFGAALCGAPAPMRRLEESKDRDRSRGKGRSSGRIGGGGKRSLSAFKAKPRSRRRAPAPRRSRKKNKSMMMDMEMCLEESMMGDSLDEVYYEDDEEFEEAKPFAMRKSFESTVVFSTCLRTSEEGEIVVPITLPDQLTRYRIWVLAEEGQKFFGFGESHVIAQMPFAIRPSLPRFMNFGDTTSFSYVLSNQTDHDIEVTVAVRVSENLMITDDSEKGHLVELPQGKRAELRVPVVAEHAGKARIQIGAQVARSRFSDAVEKELAIYSPTTNSAYVTYGELDGDGIHIQKILRPAARECHSGFGGISLVTSSTSMQNLTDSIIYLCGYPYDCMEQASSRMLGIVSTEDFLEEFECHQMPPKSELQTVMVHEIQKLQDCQQRSGGFGMWKKTSPLNAFLSVHVAHALIRTKEGGKYAIPDTLLEKSKGFLMKINSFFGQLFMGQFATAAVQTFAMYVLGHYARLGLLSDREKARLHRKCVSLSRGQQTLESRAWIALAVAALSKKGIQDALVRSTVADFLARVKDTKRKAWFEGPSYSDAFNAKGVMFASTIRENAIILELLCIARPDCPVIPRLVNYLLTQKRNGRWGSTQENVWAMLALLTYFRTFEKEVPDFSLDVWLREEYMGRVGFQGRETVFKQLDIPMSKVIISDEEQADLESQAAAIEAERELHREEIEREKAEAEAEAERQRAAAAAAAEEAQRGRRRRRKGILDSIAGDADDDFAMFQQIDARRTAPEPASELVVEEEDPLDALYKRKLQVVKSGPGRCYYRISMQYAPRDLRLHPLSFGFRVTRNYTHVENGADVRRDRKSGVYTFKLGSLVRIRLKITTNEERFNVALCDNLPAGLEVLNPALKTTIEIPPDPLSAFNETWYDHHNYRAERVEVFKNRMPNRTYSFSYVCRAMFPGSFLVPPCKAEEMYDDEVYGSSGTDFVVVEEEKPEVRMDEEEEGEVATTFEL